MWTSTLELDPAHVIPTKILGRFWRGAYFSSIAPFQVQNLPRQPLPAASWVRVRNTLAGICGSDLQLIFLKGSFAIAPAAIPGQNRSYPGHEVVGEVIEVGDDVTTLRVGDRVVLKNGPNCVTAGVQPLCRSCVTGNHILCERTNLPGPQPFGGGWSEEMLLHEQQLFRVPSDLNDMQAVLLEPSSVALHAVLRYLPQANERVLIIGAGTIGLLLLQVVRLLVPDAEVSVLARHAFQVEQAARLGAQIIYPQDSYKEVQRITGAQLYQGMFGNKMILGGYDIIYDTVGSKRTTNDSLRWARAGATVVMVGTHLYRMRADLTPIWYQEINLIGAMGHGMERWPLGTDESTSTFDIVVELIQQKRLHPEKLITHSFALSDYRNALLTAIHKGHNRAIKIIFDYAKQPPSVVPNVRAAARRHQRAVTPVPYTDSRPSQPLTPPNDAMVPPVPTPLSTPVSQLVPPASSTPPILPFGNAYETEQTGIQVPDEEWDDKTIVVSPSKFSRHSVPLQPVEPEQPTQPVPSVSMPVSPTPPIPPTPLANEEETTITAIPAHLSPASDDELLDQEGSANNENEESSFLPPSEESMNAQADVPPWLAALNANTPFSTTPDNDEVANEGQPPVPPTPVESDDVAKTVVVSSSKSSRSRRKTNALKTKNAEENRQPSSSPDSQEELPVPVVENQPIVTNSSADTLQDIRKQSTQDSDSAPTIHSE